MVTNSLCWEKYEKFSGSTYKAAGLSWMFCKAKIAWDLLFKASILHILSVYKIRTGVLVIDDTDKERSKNTTQIAKAHKIKDKKRGGYFNGQNIIFLVLVSKELTLPIGFCFYEPDPKMVAWRKEEKRLKEKGVAKCHRPPLPPHNPKYPAKKELALKLLKNFMSFFEDFKVKAVTADAFYGTEDFMSKAARITKQKQVISQIKKTQLINVNGRNITANVFFENYAGKTENQELKYKNKQITYRSAKFKVKAHNKKYYIIALKYGNESDYRYLIASDMSWRDIDIIKAYVLRWLVWVFIQAWKSYEGWNQLAKQRGIEGSDRRVILSLLCDHALSLHDDQKLCLETMRLHVL